MATLEKMTDTENGSSGEVKRFSGAGATCNEDYRRWRKWQLYG